MARAASTGPDWAAHRRAAEEEDVRFLVAAGLTLEAACVRVGVELNTLEKRLERHPLAATLDGDRPTPGLRT